jgi:hypothetical protein
MAKVRDEDGPKTPASIALLVVVGATFAIGSAAVIYGLARTPHSPAAENGGGLLISVALVALQEHNRRRAPTAQQRRFFAASVAMLSLMALGHAAFLLKAFGG